MNQPGRRKRIKLKPELVPRTLWTRSVYRQLRAEGRRRDWEDIRRVIRSRCRGKCQICGHFQEKFMICHEKWKYDKDSLVATLMGFKWICPTCNNSLHLGRTIVRLSEKNPQIVEEAIDHMMKVNDRTRIEMDRIITNAFWKWVDYADEDWTIYIDPKLVKRFPQLEGMEL